MLLKQLNRKAIRICSIIHQQCSSTVEFSRLIPSVDLIDRNSVITPLIRLPQFRCFHSSSALMKVRKNERKTKAPNDFLEKKNEADNVYVHDAMKEMKQLEEILSDELAKHFSLQVDLRAYEDIVVKLDNNEEHRMNRLGRVVLKSPQMVMINFNDNPTAIKAAKLALQKSNLNINPQQEGVTLFIPVPRMTRDRRQQLANTAKAKMFNDYKEALNQVYSKYDKKASNEMKSHDDAARTRSALLSMKRVMEGKGMELIEAKRMELLKEVA